MLNLLPRERRPRTLTRAQWATAALGAVTTILGLVWLITHGSLQDRYLRRVSDEIRRLEPQAKAVEHLAAEVTRQKRLLATIDALEGSGVRPLALLQELTDLVPTDTWLQALTMDRQGVELTGQAAAASQLIPLLEGSKALERVEFTSPVTKAQGKEQFRLRAAWEAPARTGAR
jgi:general secretion pathway protein L